MRPQRKRPKPSSAIGTAFARVYFGSVVRFLARVTTRSPDASQLMRFSWEMIADRVAPTVILGALERAGFSADRTVSLGIFREYVATRIH